MPEETKHLYRSRNNKVIGGVCAGLANYLNIDVTIVRVLFVLGTVITHLVPGLLAYIALLLIIPEEPLV